MRMHALVHANAAANAGAADRSMVLAVIDADDAVADADDTDDEADDADDAEAVMVLGCRGNWVWLVRRELQMLGSALVA